MSVPVDLSRRPSAAEVALDVVDSFPGTQNGSIDAGTGLLRFEMQFPGNLSSLVSRLRECLIPVGDEASVQLPVRRTPGEDAEGGPDAERRILEDGPEIWDVQFRRGRYVTSARIEDDCRLIATIVPDSKSMHQLYDALLRLRYLADETPVIARM